MMTITERTQTDRINDLVDAREHLESAIDLIRVAVRGTSEENRADAYIIPHLQSWLGQEWCSIDNLIAALEGRDDDAD
jgi:hypothetical protein